MLVCANIYKYCIYAMYIINMRYTYTHRHHIYKDFTDSKVTKIHLVQFHFNFI